MHVYARSEVHSSSNLHEAPSGFWASHTPVSQLQKVPATQICMGPELEPHVSPNCLASEGPEHLPGFDGVGFRHVRSGAQNSRVGVMEQG
jgi:hypothetical protein